MKYTLHHKHETISTNLDARGGAPWDVFTADFQTSGRGRLDHKWLSPPGTNLLMSVVLPVRGLSPDHVSTLPLVVGLSVARGLSPFVSRGLSPMIKWPNDVLIAGRKISGILCERDGDGVIVGIGVNVNQTKFPQLIAEKSTSLRLILSKIGVCPQIADGVCPQIADGVCPHVDEVRDAILGALAELFEVWRMRGFAAVYRMLQAIDFLRGQSLSVWQTSDDAEPIRGVSGGIRPDGSLDVGGHAVYAGEAHVDEVKGSKG